MKAALGQWSKLLAPFRKLFAQPGATRFFELRRAWVLCPGRRIGTRLWGKWSPRPTGLGMKRMWRFVANAYNPKGLSGWGLGASVGVPSIRPPPSREASTLATSR